jgi:hypothetical protein
MDTETSYSRRSRKYVILRLAERAEGPLKCNLRVRNGEKTRTAIARSLDVCAARDDTRFASTQRSGNVRLNTMMSVSSSEENGLLAC